MENLKNYLFELCSESAPSGREDLLCSLERLVTPLADKCYRDSANNLIAVKYSKIPGAEKILIDAHADEVGLIVTEVDDNGFIHFENHTGLDPRSLPASTVTVLGKRAVTGIIATLPPHLLKDADTKKTPKMKDMLIDIGYDAKTARELVKVGDLIALRGNCVELKNNLVVGKSFDNRACAAVLIDVLSKLSKLRPRYDVYFAFSAAEEFGGYGAKTAAFEIVPDSALVLDVTFGVSPYTDNSKAKPLASGAVIGIAPILDTHITENLIGTARARALPYTTEVVGSRTGTNADNIVTAKTGVRTALLSLPLRYMHSAGEVVSLEDMRTLSRLVLSHIEYRGGAFGE